MEYVLLTEAHPLWKTAMEYARQCSWRAGSYLAGEMEKGFLSDWERVVLAINEAGEPVGFCTVVKRDCIPDPALFPLIGFVFIDESCRGRRLGGAMIDFAAAYLRNLGFDRVYLGSDHMGLYEKYGFRPIGNFQSIHGGEEMAFVREL